MAKKKNKKEENPEVIYLLRRRKKGLLRIVFSRFGITAFFLLLQIAIFVSMLTISYAYNDLFALVCIVFMLVMLLHLFKIDMDATAKLTWLLLLTMFPLPVSVLLWLSQRHIGHRHIKNRLRELYEQTKGKLTQDEKIIKDPDIVDSATDDLCHYLNLSGSYPLYANTSVKFFPLGEYKFEAMLEELKKAEKFIFMEYFIIEEGLMWGSVLKILADKAAQGVDVRVMYDGMCEISALSSDYPKRLAKLGIKAKAFSRIYPFVSTQYNYRDHRKILVIDGKTAFNGGVNLGDEYINHIERFGHWKDTAVMLKGDAVQSFTMMFLQMWNMTEKELHWDEYLFPDGKDAVPALTENASGYVMPYADSPMDGYKVGESVYMDILNRAKNYVHIMTPYLVLDNELETALKFAAQRGVDVKLILPGVPDKKSAFALAKSHYKYLIKTGIEIYEYDPGFVHAKVFVCDDIKAVIGTINLDYRSLYHHFECATYMYKTDCIAEIENDFQYTLPMCRRVTKESIKKERMSYKIRGSLLKLIAPLM